MSLDQKESESLNISKKTNKKIDDPGNLSSYSLMVQLSFESVYQDKDK